jgi:hypothetical protein
MNNDCLAESLKVLNEDDVIHLEVDPARPLPESLILK